MSRPLVSYVWIKRFEATGRLYPSPVASFSAARTSPGDLMRGILYGPLCVYKVACWVVLSPHAGSTFNPTRPPRGYCPTTLLSPIFHALLPASLLLADLARLVSPRFLHDPKTSLGSAARWQKRGSQAGQALFPRLVPRRTAGTRLLSEQKALRVAR
ncbi:hypothetical protein KM043_004977 [Ampulex compressa]|nr:hypothetical protein KM043_004977 [Ampulex compressa]